jgi:predicted NBD/HSP70 family sugar kinase
VSGLDGWNFVAGVFLDLKSKMVNLKFPAPLDPDFQPAVLWNRQYVAAAKAAGDAVPLVLGLEREGGLVSRFATVVRPTADADTLHYVERTVKFLLWAWGGWKLHFGGPKAIGQQIAKIYSDRGARKFDCEMMGLAYGKKFQVMLTTAAQVPANRGMPVAVGGHIKGCRIGFDLGASNYKVAAVVDGEAVFTETQPWNPQIQADPAYHYRHLSAALHRAAAHLPRVDAIGGSSAGIIVDNEIRVASLLRAVPPKDFPQAAGIFKRLQREWNVPVVVMNDGDVTALAGALSLQASGLLGLAMGSSEAAGFLDAQGRISGQLNELAFAPVDYNPQAAADEWSGDVGVGVLYFSQQAVNQLLPAAGIPLPEKLGLSERSLEVQTLMARGDARAARIYETIGVYLGYTIAHYAAYYDYRHLLILGGVMTGTGGDRVIAKAREVLAGEFPEVAQTMVIHVSDEKSRRIGQAVAAASLPGI